MREHRRVVAEDLCRDVSISGAADVEEQAYVVRLRCRHVVDTEALA
jgi:hypothetical protein